MAIHKTTEQQQLWQHRSGQVVRLDTIAPADETDESAEYRYSSQGSDMGAESEFLSVGWVKIDSSEYLGKPELTHEQELTAEQRLKKAQAFNAQFPIVGRRSKH